MSSGRTSRFLLGILLVAWSAIGHAEDNNADANIVSLQGNGHYKPQQSDPWKDAVIKQDLFAGNFVRTAEYSRMGILFSDRTQIRLNEKTLLQIKQVQSAARPGSETRLRLNRGRAWTQTKTLPEKLFMETPSATAAIRGTDWELEVDDEGTATITVLSGQVDFFNDKGRVSVGRNEAARARPGQAPEKIVFVSPRDRVQWVTAYAIEPLRYIRLASGNASDSTWQQAATEADKDNWSAAEQGFSTLAQQNDARGHLGMGYVNLHKGDASLASESFNRARQLAPAQQELLQLGNISVSIVRGELGSAIPELQSLSRLDTLQQPAAFLLLSDIMIYEGDLKAAADYIQTGLQRFPDSALLYSQLARIYLFADKRSDSLQQVNKALSMDAKSVDAQVARGDLARIEGDAPGAEAAYGEAKRINPDDDRGWHGLGVVQSEKENVKKGRSNLLKALDLNPAGAGYQGELGTLETFANNFDAARTAFNAALEKNPDDYVALTGLGLMKLKLGDTEGALNTFLRAGVLEPRYARAHLYTGVAYYQLGRTEQALAELERASELDDKDPMPYFMASIIYTDNFRPSDAVNAAREATKRLPYLKSLNQLSNDQKGSANLGRAYAYFGLEEWAQHQAQESYTPYWAGSHLFLADRYPGYFTKNSELFQGFIADPTVFGASNKENTLLPKPGHHVTAGYRYGNSKQIHLYSPYVELNGLLMEPVPISYFLSREETRLYEDSGPYLLDNTVASVGIKPTHELGIFLFASRTDVFAGVDDIFGSGVQVESDLWAERFDIGLNYKFSPTAQLWMKSGYLNTNDDIYGLIALRDYDQKTIVDLGEHAVRFTFDATERHEVSIGAERADKKFHDRSYIDLTPPNMLLYAYFDNSYEDRSWEFYISDRFKVTDKLLVQADLFYQHHQLDADYLDYDYLNQIIFPPPAYSLLGTARESTDPSGFHPRLGMVYNFNERALVRLAYQDWVRPTSFSTLGPVATAGIPLDDRLVGSGGELIRFRGQLEWEVSKKLFTSAFLDHKRINNHDFLIEPYTLTDEENLLDLQRREFASLSAEDLLENVSVPAFDEGKISSAGLSANYILDKNWSIYGRYVYSDSENIGNYFPGNMIPYVPEHAAAIGATWTDPRGFFVTGRATYRSTRYTDEANLNELESGWDVSMDAFWESRDKRYVLRLGFDDAFSPNNDTLYSADIRLRF